MSPLKTNTRNIIICGAVWFACIVLLISIAVLSGWKNFATALLPLVFFTDLVIWLAYSLFQLPCGFTEWVCYPFWPFKYHGFHMRWGVLIRLVQIVTLLFSGHWLFELVKNLF